MGSTGKFFWPLLGSLICLRSHDCHLWTGGLGWSQLDSSSLAQVVFRSPVDNPGFVHKANGQGSLREDRSTQSLLIGLVYLELSHCYLCYILLAKVCPKTGLDRIKGGKLELKGGPVTSYYRGHGYQEGGKTFYHIWCEMISYRKIGYIKQNMDSKLQNY